MYVNKLKNRLTVLFMVALLALPMFLFVMCFVRPAQASLMITPLRAVFEGRDRAATITLINNSNETRTYRMGWRLQKMTEDGRYEAIEEGDTTPVGQKAVLASKMIRFSPRQVTIEPGGRQRIRLSLRKKADLTDGEYRAHLTFTRLPELPDPTSTDIKGAQFKLYLNMAFSIPVIVRQGDMAAESEIMSARYVPPAKEMKGKSSVELTLSRKGTGSTFGRVRLYASNTKGREEEIGVLNNVAIFPEIDQKTIRIPLTEGLNTNVVRVVYEGDGEFKGRIWDEKTVTLNR